jgi:hypothetical protein
MGRRVLKECQVYFDKNFVQGMMTATNQWKKPEEAVSLSGLKSKSLTAVLNEEWPEVKCKKQAGKGVRRYRALGRAERLKFLASANVFTFLKTDAEIVEEKKEEEEEKAVEEEDALSEVDWGDVSEVNDSSGAEDSKEGESAPFVLPVRASKRQKVSGDACGFLQNRNVRACIPEACESCRLSRDSPGDGEIFEVDLGASGVKPKLLTRWGEQSYKLYLLTVREDGKCYYGKNKVWMYASVLWLVLADKVDMETMLSRVLLYVSPSYTMVFDPDIVIVRWSNADVNPDLNELGVDKFEGMSWISPVLAAYCLKRPLASLAPLYPPFQFRGLFWNSESGETGLGKGMVQIDWRLPGQTLMLTQSCVKAKKQGYDDKVVYGLDVTKEFAHEMEAPTLQSSLLAALQLRVAVQTVERTRKDAGAKLESWRRECVEQVRRNLVKKAYGIEKSDIEGKCTIIGHPEEYRVAQVAIGADPLDGVLRVEPELMQCETLMKLRKPCGSIDVLHQEPLKRTETQMEVLEQSLLEAKPHSAHLRTRGALRRGGARFWGLHKSQMKAPHCSVKGLGFTLVALADLSGRLLDRQCLVISQGKVYEGECAMYRCPIHAPWDLEVHTAVPIPVGMDLTGYPDNSVILSAEGYVNSIMAGGDLDGDLNMLMFSPKLVEFLKFTQAGVDLLDRRAIEEGVVGRMCRRDKTNFISKQGKARLVEYVEFAHVACTKEVRGKVASMSSRAAYCAIRSDCPMTDGTGAAALDFVVLCHKAFDVPKHLSHKQVFDVMDALQAVAGFKARDMKVTKWLDRSLRYKFPELRHKNVVEKTVPHVAAILGEGKLGMVWIPQKELYLSFAAGKRVGEILLSEPKNEKHLDRDPTRKPIIEIAHLIAQKMLRTVGDARKAINDGRVDDTLSALKGCRANDITSWGTLERSVLS